LTKYHPVDSELSCLPVEYSSEGDMNEVVCGVDQNGHNPIECEDQVDQRINI
jgi:hypothetical protein